MKGKEELWTANIDSVGVKERRDDEKKKQKKTQRKGKEKRYEKEKMKKKIIRNKRNRSK